MPLAVYKLWQGRFTEAWRQLPQEEQQRMLGLVMEALNTAGSKGSCSALPLDPASDGPSSVSKNSPTWRPYNATNRS
jgi:hypothetical protein